MNAHSLKIMHVPPLAAGVAAILVSAAAMAMVPVAELSRDWSAGTVAAAAPESSDESAARPAIDQVRMKARCDECVVIDSMRVIAAAGDTPAMSEIIVRQRNGSTRVLTRTLSDAGHANWRRGERIVLIGGAAGYQTGKSLRVSSASR